MKTITLSSKNPKTLRIPLNKAKRITLQSPNNTIYRLCLSDALDSNDQETTTVCKLINKSTIIKIHPLEMSFMPKDIFVPKSFQLFWHEDICKVTYELD